MLSINTICFILNSLKYQVIYAKHWKNIKFFSLVSQFDCQYPYIGGGSTVFSLQELEAYIIAGCVPVIGISFKFREYILQSKLMNISLDNALVCDIPVHSILLKLTVTELREVAACHNIICHSKMKSRNIQNAIKNHMCEDCKFYVAVFDAVDAVDTVHQKHQKSIINLQATKKYQKKQGDAYKIANLLSVKKAQEKQGKRYKKANLKSAIKYQEKQGQSYKKDNLESTKRYQEQNREQYRKAHLAVVVKHLEMKKVSKFPPSPPEPKLQHRIISDACGDMSPDMISESGCAVCGRLTLLIDLLELSKTKVDLSILVNPCVAMQERFSHGDPPRNIDGPVLDEDLSNICKTCYKSLSERKVPLLALANGKWIGKVPKQLSGLFFAEQLLVAKIRHNRCIVRVSSGMYKMRANAISFPNPIPKVYNILPPPLEEMDEVLAFIYTGPCKPTKSDFERTPLLVRKNKVRDALEWLKLNHIDYFDLEISEKNLDEYPEDRPFVVVDYHQSFSNKDPESTAVYENENEEGTETGKCPFVVNGLTGEEYSTKSVKALKAVALQHLTSNKKILAIGHNDIAEKTY